MWLLGGQEEIYPAELGSIFPWCGRCGSRSEAKLEGTVEFNDCIEWVFRIESPRCKHLHLFLVFGTQRIRKLKVLFRVLKKDTFH